MGAGADKGIARRTLDLGRTRQPRIVYDSSGYLTAEAICWLARRIWWGEYEHVTTSQGWHVKGTPLALWYSPATWPAWWPLAQWVDLGAEGADVLLRIDGTSEGAWVWAWRPAPWERPS